MNFWFAKGEVNVSSTRGTAGGFLVIYGGEAAYSIYDSVGHDDLLAKIATSRRIEKQRVLDQGIRLFFMYVKGGVLISGVREIDNEKILSDPPKYAKIIKKVMK